jgi:hypothetical protein
MMIQTQKLEYQDHKDEIASLNKILADIQACQPFPPELTGTVMQILARLDFLMTAEKATLKLYGT